MNGSALTRWLPVTGPLYGVLYVIGLFIIVGDEIDEKTDAGIVSFYADSGNRTGHIIGFFVVAVSLIFFLLFVGLLRELLRSDADDSLLSGLVLAGGAAAAGLFLAGTAALAATALAAQFINDFVVEANLVRLQFGLGYALLAGGVILSCGLVLATSILAVRTSTFPAWLSWLGLIAVVLAVIEVFLLPLLVIPAWALIVGIVLIVRQPEARPAPALGASTP